MSMLPKAVLPDQLPLPIQCLAQSLASYNNVLELSSICKLSPSNIPTYSTVSRIFKKCKLALGHKFIELSLVQRNLYWEGFQNFAPASQATSLCCSMGSHFRAWVECYKRQGKESMGNWKIHKSYLCQQVATSTSCKRCQEGESLVSQPWYPENKGKTFPDAWPPGTAPSFSLNF